MPRSFKEIEELAEDVSYVLLDEIVYYNEKEKFDVISKVMASWISHLEDCTDMTKDQIFKILKTAIKKEL